MSSHATIHEEVVVTPAHTPVRQQFRELNKYKELLYFLVWRELKIRYKQTAIGAAWAVLQPLLMTALFTIFFGRLAHLPSGGLPYPVFYFSALVPWTFFSNSVNNATNAFVANQSLVTKVYFPRVILPVSVVLAGLVDFAIAFLILMCILFAYGVSPGLSMAFVPLFIMLAALTTLAMSIWTSSLNALYRDLRYAVPVLLQFWFFASPVVYPTRLVPRPWRVLYEVNPMVGVIEGFRWSLTGQGAAPGVMAAISIAIVVLVLMIGTLYFWRWESVIADLV
jgi:lipopolysaccharide transport system permease protein